MANPSLPEVITISDDDEEEEESEEEEEGTASDRADDEHQETEDKAEEDAKPIGHRLRWSGKGKERREHYEAFDYAGAQYRLEDNVLLAPADCLNEKPGVAVIKDICVTVGGGAVTVLGQRLYRPEEAEIEGCGGEWRPFDNRELFYSFDLYEFRATRVMHECVVHFVPSDKGIPDRKRNPGFIVRKVYYAQEKRLLELRDREFEEDEQQEIEMLLAKTEERLGGFLPNLGTEDVEQVIFAASLGYMTRSVNN